FVSTLADGREESLARGRKFAAMLVGMRFAAHGIVSRARACASLAGAHAALHDEHLLACCAELDARFAEPVIDHAPVYAKAIGDIKNRELVGLVETDEVIGIDVIAYSGHVYDFSTVMGMYTSNGIIGHNCRCGSGAVFEVSKSRRELAKTNGAHK